jgi:hypothetical protein
MINKNIARVPRVIARTRNEDEASPWLTHLHSHDDGWNVREQTRAENKRCVWRRACSARNERDIHPRRSGTPASGGKQTVGALRVTPDKIENCN